MESKIIKSSYLVLWIQTDPQLFYWKRSHIPDPSRGTFWRWWWFSELPQVKISSCFQILLWPLMNSQVPLPEPNMLAHENQWLKRWIISFWDSPFSGAFAVSFRKGTPPNLPYSSSFPLPSWLPLEHASWTLVGWRDEPPQLGEKTIPLYLLEHIYIYINIYAHMHMLLDGSAFLWNLTPNSDPTPKKLHSSVQLEGVFSFLVVRKLGTPLLCA